MNSIHSKPNKPTNESKVQNKFKSEKNNFENNELRDEFGFENILEKTNVILFLRSDENKFLREYPFVLGKVMKNHEKLEKMINVIKESEDYKKQNLSIDEKKKYEKMNVELTKCEWEIKELQNKKEKYENNRIILKNMNEFSNMYYRVETLDKELNYMEKEEITEKILEITKIEDKMYGIINYILPKEIVEEKKFTNEFNNVKKILEKFKERRRNYKGRIIRVKRSEYENVIRRESTIHARIKEIEEEKEDVKGKKENQDISRLSEILSDNTETSLRKIGLIETKIKDKKIIEYGRDIVVFNRRKRELFRSIESSKIVNSSDVKKDIAECDNIIYNLEFLIKKIKREYKNENTEDIEKIIRKEISSIEEKLEKLETKLTKYNKVIRDFVKYQRTYKLLEKVSIAAWVSASIPISIWFKNNYQTDSIVSLIIGTSVGFNAYLSTMIVGLTGDLILTRNKKK